MRLPILTAFLVCVPFALAESSRPPFERKTITVDTKGTKLAYTDSGPPQGLSTYTTVFGVHGMGFNSGVFEKLQVAARSSLRFVGVNRRSYAGSTPFSSEEIRVINNGTDSEKTSFHAARGMELLTFMHTFVQQERIRLKPGKGSLNSGIAIVGWSLGSALALAAVSNLPLAPAEIRTGLGPYINTLILHEPGAPTLGLPIAPQNWVPWTIVDPTIPESVELPLFAEFVSGYAQHGDLSTRSAESLQWLAHAFTLRPPSVYGITAAGRGSVIETQDSIKLEIPFQVNFGAQLSAAFQTIYSKELYQVVPYLKNFYIGGEHTLGFGPFTVWAVQDDDKAHGGGFIKAKIVNGISHISPWDDPAITLNAYQDCIAGRF